MDDDDDLELKVVTSTDETTRWIQVKSRSGRKLSDESFYTELECFLHNVELDEVQTFLDLTIH